MLGLERNNESEIVNLLKIHLKFIVATRNDKDLVNLFISPHSAKKYTSYIYIHGTNKYVKMRV